MKKIGVLVLALCAVVGSLPLYALTPDFLGHWVLVMEGRAIGARKVVLHPVRDDFRIELDIHSISAGFRKVWGREHIRGSCQDRIRLWNGVGYPAPKKVTVLSIQEIGLKSFQVMYEFEVHPRRIVRGSVLYTLQQDGMLKQRITMDTYDYNPVEKGFIRVAHVVIIRLYEKMEIK